MITDCDIVCLSISRWDAPVSSPALCLAKELSKSNRVFYIDHPYSWKDYIKERNTEGVKKRKKALLFGKNMYSKHDGHTQQFVTVTTRITAPINFLPGGWLYKKMSQRNDRIILNTIRKLISDFEVKEFIYINFFDPYFLGKFPKDIQPVRTVYHCMDDITQVDYSNRHGSRLEHEIIKNFDYTLCTSAELTRLKKLLSPDVHFFPNAADHSLFKSAYNEHLPKPEELKHIHTKIIGYIGSIEYRMDFELLKKIAAAHSDKTIVLVGPINTTEHLKSGINRLPNVVFTGSKSITQLPSYLQYFDCTIIPFKKNILTKSIYPLKINEYLAAGKPVVATNFSDDIASFGKVAYIANSDENFLMQITNAIEENTHELQQKRIAVAAQNTWHARADQFWNIISHEPGKKQVMPTI